MVAVYQIRANYVKIISKDGGTPLTVRKLTKILLQDFDERYHPVDAVSGKVCYTGTGMAEIGFRNKCTTVLVVCYPYPISPAMGIG